VAGAIGFSILYTITLARKPLQNPKVADLAYQKDVSSKYDEYADKYDGTFGWSETIMGINRLRKKLARKCVGDVLEVSCGTGRNLSFYDVGKRSEVQSLTFVDMSPQMIELCKKKWIDLNGGAKEPYKPGLPVRFFTGSAIGAMPPGPTKEKYDTIIQTMGLCSTASPVALLTNLAKHLDTNNPDARILLLEHGRSYREWMNRILDNTAEKQADMYGCWHNREIGALIEEAARKTGFEVVHERRHILGTVWMFELKPGPDATKLAATVETAPPEPSRPTAVEPAPAASWRDWLGWK
jgi:methyltransferase OMS1, mitochondrial